VAAEPETIADFARARHAQFAISGWFDRVGEELRIAVVVWRIGPTGGATAVAEAKQQGPTSTYHALLGSALAQAWEKAGLPVDAAKRERFGRSLSADSYPVFMMGRGLSYFIAGDLKNAEHDLERSVFLNPKLFEAQRLLGELYLRRAEPKDAARAAAKFNYALELAPDDVPSLRAAAAAAIAAGQWERGRELWTAVAIAVPWDIDARFQLGRADWQLGSATAAEHQLQQVVARQPDHLPARHVLVLIHASRGDIQRFATELQLIALRAPADLDVKSDLASAYGALGRWDQAAVTLEALAQARPNDVAMLVRAGDAQRRRGDTDAALRWYERAARAAPESSMPGFAIGQTQFDAGRLVAANQTYLALQRYGGVAGATAHALGTIAFLQQRYDDAARYFRRAVREAPRNLASRRAAIAAQVQRNDVVAARQQLEPALSAWPQDGELHYLAGFVYRMAGDRDRALGRARALPPLRDPQRRAEDQDGDGGGVAKLTWQPELVRPWGDSEAMAAELARFAAAQNAMAAAREAYQADIIGLLGALGKGPSAKRGAVKACPTAQIAARWVAAQTKLEGIERLGVDLEAAFARIVRHDELGMTAGLLPNARLAVASAKRDYPLALRDVAELRAEWSQGLTPELHAVGCTVQSLTAAASDRPSSRAFEEPPEPALAPSAARAVVRTTFFVDNTSCAEAVEVYVDDKPLGRAAAGQRLALVAEGGERSLCLIVPGTAQCGDRGTARRVYLHDGWTVTMQCSNR